ncbi:MAG TPA: tRNA uridine-5-carboxymethylaminomethyl(34) synthesis GTPase MnmE [Ignavibacteriaceae bacterium]|nr:tRNA uridine-5-carboxymethylaminomethyl(34) synthesis GTPase MnmE [Ignavibacteriaceae bacterium]
MIITSTEDTIAAIATPPGNGAISIIRVSGSQTFEIADQIFLGQIKLSDAPTHTIHYGRILDHPDELVDDVLVSVFRNPHSYTGEDCVEINTHGSPIIQKKIIDLLVHSGARLAEPGEFTKRAFLNNRIDLAQAEAVIDLINASTDASLRGARNQLDGLLSKKIGFLKNNLVNAISLVEIGLDFAEEDIEFIEYKELLERIETVSGEIEKLLASYSFGKIIKDGVNVAIIGKPNVGKSSLLNYLLKESRAIVSSIPGTTRDIIREEISINGILFRLFDTAGIRITQNEIEKEGVARSREAIKNSDIIILMNDAVQEYSGDLLNEISSFVEKHKIISVINKIDLIENRDCFKNNIGISAKTGEGINHLLDSLSKAALKHSNYSEKSAIVSNTRHYQCLKNANDSLENAKESIINSYSGEFISVDIRSAITNLSEIIGEVTTEDILKNIFQKFCIGK